MKFLAKSSVAAVALGLITPLLGVAVTTAPVAAAVSQTGRTVLLPSIVQGGAKVAPSHRARLTGRIVFRPVRTGRPVAIQQRVGSGSWQTVTVQKQDRRGAVAFTGPARSRGAWVAYRGVARPWGDLGRKISPARTLDQTWRTSFREEFRGTRLNRDRWDYRHLGLFSPDSDRACSASRKDAVQVGGGRARLQVKLDRARKRRIGACRGTTIGGHWFKNGHVGTQGKFQFRYGVAAARVKFARPVGAHGAFWLQSTRPDLLGRGPARDGAEIDVVEYFGKDYKDGDIYSFIHYSTPDGVQKKIPRGVPVKTARRALRGDDDWFKKYHVFSVEWTPKAYVFRVDGVQTLRITQGVSKAPEFLILSMLSSGWELKRLNTRALPLATQVDWVRVWQTR